MDAGEEGGVNRHAAVVSTTSSFVSGWESPGLHSGALRISSCWSCGSWLSDLTTLSAPGHRRPVSRTWREGRDPVCTFGSELDQVSDALDALLV